MNISSSRPGKSGFVSYVMVLTTGAVLTTLMVYTYRRAMATQAMQASVTLRTDYGEKEDAILRSIVAITPNRAIRAMQGGSSASSAVSEPLRWQNIFSEALDLANARTSIASNLQTSLDITGIRGGNAGDSGLSRPDLIFKAVNNEAGYVSAGVQRSLGAGYPAPLTLGDTSTRSRDATYPIISSSKAYDPVIASSKVYGSLAKTVETSLLSVSDYPNFNLLKYPNINFGYAKPGDPLVGKRNWWAFSMNVAASDTLTTQLNRQPRDFVLSIYEIPSQLAISASSFMSLGEFASGEAWKNVTIEGGVFAGKAEVLGSTALTALSSRRGMTMSGDSTIGGQNFSNNPFAPGVREEYQVTQGEFFPVSLASESGRVAFVSINRGVEVQSNGEKIHPFFDRFSTSTETNTLSPTAWNDYSCGAQQCAMRLDITDVVSETNNTPTKLRFSYLKNNIRKDLVLDLNTSGINGLPPGYLLAGDENSTYNFGSAVVDVAYGKNGTYAYQTGVTGLVTFNNARFGDPLWGVRKNGYYKPSYPFEVKLLPSGKTCIAVYPQRFASFLASLNADITAVNNSLVVNVDYTNFGPTYPLKPRVDPCEESDYGVILQECADLSSFTKGFSLVTNLRTYIGDDFNVIPATTIPAGYTPTGTFYPPCSLFAPEKRYGVEVNPFAVNLGGQIGSLASDTASNAVRPLDSKNMSGSVMGADNVIVNLRPILHPAALPPITMMNWLVVLEERRKEFVNY